MRGPAAHDAVSGMLRFQEIVGHQGQIELLRRAVRRERLHHAYLFVGPEGAGKRTVATALAAAVQCPEAAGDACGECPSCRCIDDRNHPDVHWLEQRKGKRDITIEQVRELQRELALHRFSGKKKVAVIDPLTLLNLHAQNALLKTLEEPPGDSLLLLIAGSTGGVLPTVLSRCLRLRFSPLTVEQAAAVVARRKDLPEDRALLLAALGYGSLGKALAGDEAEIPERQECFRRLAGLSSEDMRGITALAEEMGGDREKALRFLDWVRGWLRDVMVLQVTGSTSGVYNRDLLEPLQRAAAAGRVQRSTAALAEIDNVTRAIHRNYNRRMVLEGFIPMLLN